MTSPEQDKSLIDREAVARIIDAWAWKSMEGPWEADSRWLSEDHRRGVLTEWQGYALRKADAIIALLPTPVVVQDGSSNASPSPLDASRHSSDETVAPSAAVAVYFQEREDGGLCVWSDDEPGLILWGMDADAVSRDVWAGIKALRDCRAGKTL